MKSSGNLKGTLSQLIKDKSEELGFSACGISKVEVLEKEISHLKNWHSKGYSGDLSYMKKYSDIRPSPFKLLKGAKSVISLLIKYFPEKIIPENDNYIIAKYAYGNDYHKIIKDKLHLLAKFISDSYCEMNYRCFVDSAPILEKSWASKSGLGSIGKNTLLITKSGSFYFLGEIVTDIELDYNETSFEDLCGNCTKCIDACPTNAIVEAKVLDVNRCISYHTIESADNNEIKLKVDFKDRIYGCDICQDVCPWNKNPTPTEISAFAPSKELMSMQKKNWDNLTEDEFNSLFKKSSIKRIGYAGLIRNIKHNKQASTTSCQTDI